MDLVAKSIALSSLSFMHGRFEDEFCQSNKVDNAQD